MNGLARKVRFIDGLILPRAEPQGLILGDHPVTLLRRPDTQEKIGQKEGSEVQGTSEMATGNLKANAVIANKPTSSNATSSSPGKRKKANQQPQTPSLRGITFTAS